jgi:MFS family permease
MSDTSEFDWRTIAALNAVSALAQVGQFGIAFVVLPVWLSEHGLDATHLGMFAASLWLGQLPGLAVAPWLCKRLGPMWVIVMGLACTVCALPWIAISVWPYWMAGGMLCGFGLGLRWIGVEPWLYRIAPAEARGRLVGFHETLIALAPIAAPVLASTLGLQGNALFWIGVAFALAAIVPLAFARKPAIEISHQPLEAVAVVTTAPLHDTVFRQGIVIALLGGMLEAAVSGLFALFAQGRGLEVGQTADLLAIFGLGGLLMQYGVGWLADHRGVGFAAVSCSAGIVAVCIALVLPLSYTMIMISVFLLGGFITALLTLALIASTLAKSGNIAKNVSAVSMLYTISAVVGPLAAGAAMKSTHSDALMWFASAAALVMACVLAPTAISSK